MSSYPVGGTYESSVGGSGESEVGWAANVLFRWNGVDTTQFATAQDYNLVGTGPSLSVLNDREDTSYLSMDSGAGTFTGGRIFFITTLFPRRFRVEWHVIRNTGPTTAGNGDRGLVMILSNGLAGALMYGIGAEFRPTSASPFVFPKRYNAGARAADADPLFAAAAGANSTADLFGTYYRLIVEAEAFPTGAVPPQFTTYGHSWSALGTPTFNDGDAVDSREQAAWDAGWANQTLSRIGIGIYHANNVAQRVDIAELIVYQHPKDY